MNNPKKISELSNKPADYISSAIRGVIGTVPYAGSILAELFGIIIPNQRTDRIAQFVETLDDKFSKLEQEFIDSQLRDQHFTDLLEEAAKQVAVSLSDERREYIANLIANSLSEQDIEYSESRHLLRMLGELNDIELIWLRNYLNPAMGSDNEFREKHSNVLTSVIATMTDPPIVVEKQSLQESYREHLASLGLLRPIYETDNQTNLPKFDKFSGELIVRGYRITSLGRLLLRKIGLDS
jgi:hypothetical protein